MTQYSMKPISNGTRLREDHTTFAPVIDSYNRGQLVIGDEIWEAPADGSEVKKGDKWLHVTHIGNMVLEQDKQGWMAYVHKGYTICDNFKTISGEPSPTPTPTPTPTEATFPESFTLVDSKGNRAEFAFVRILLDGE